MKTARVLYGLLAACWVFVSAPEPVLAQRIQFSSQLPETAPAAAPLVAPGTAPSTTAPAPFAPYSYSPSGPPPTYAPAGPAGGSAAPPTYVVPGPGSAAPPSTYAAPAPAPGLGGSAPGIGGTAPGSMPGVLTPPVVTGPPGATLEGGIQAPPPAWDPYGCPGQPPSPLLPQDPYLQPGVPPTFGTTFANMQKLIQRLGVDYVWMPGSGAHELGISDVDLSVTFAVPFLYNTQTPLLITPGFTFHFWSGPGSAFIFPPPLQAYWGELADMPAQTYDAYLSTAWNPQVTPWFGGELEFRIGVYSDFKKVTEQAIRFTGKGLAVLSFSPSFKVKAGVWYLDRNRVKLLPAGGVVWTPNPINPDWCFEILFPNPKISKRLTNIGNTEWRGYLRGEYGGGAWAFTRSEFVIPLIRDQVDFVDYNDIRVGLGLEFITLRNLRGLFEAGVAFERELRYDSKLPEVYYLNTTVFLRAGLAY